MTLSFLGLKYCKLFQIHQVHLQLLSMLIMVVRPCLMLQLCITWHLSSDSFLVLQWRLLLLILRMRIGLQRSASGSTTGRVVKPVSRVSWTVWSFIHQHILTWLLSSRVAGKRLHGKVIRSNAEKIYLELTDAEQCVLINQSKTTTTTKKDLNEAIKLHTYLKQSNFKFAETIYTITINLCR